LHPYGPFYLCDGGSQSKIEWESKVSNLLILKKEGRMKGGGAHRIQREVKHDNMINIQVQTPSSQICANQCGAIIVVTLELVEVFNPAFR
jgi:hypothetical protein